MKKIILVSVFYCFLFTGCATKEQVPPTQLKSVRDGEIITVAENFSFSSVPEQGSIIYIDFPGLWPQVYRVRWVKLYTDFKSKKIQKYEIMADFISEKEHPELYQ